MPQGQTDPAHGLSERARRARVWGTGQVESAGHRLQEARETSRVVDSAVSALESETETGGGVLAAAVAFRCFLFLVPYTLVVVELASFIFGGFSSATPHEIAHRAGVTGLIAKSLSDATMQSAWKRMVALVGALVITLWTTRSLLRVLSIVHEFMWRMPVRASHVSVRRICAVVGGFTLFSVVLALVHRLHIGSLLGVLLYALIALVVPFVAWTALSVTMPRPSDAPWWSVLPGSCVVAVGSCVLQLLTVYWLSWEIERKSSSYGAIGVALALLAWAYLLGRLLTASIALNSTLWRRNAARLAATPTAEHLPPTPSG